MARGNARHQQGRHKFYDWAETSAGELADARARLDGMNANDPDFTETLDTALQAGADMQGLATRMDRGSVSRRVALARMLARHTLPPVEQEGM
jgi:hypothetical protein